MLLGIGSFKILRANKQNKCYQKMLITFIVQLIAKKYVTHFTVEWFWLKCNDALSLLKHTFLLLHFSHMSKHFHAYFQKMKILQHWGFS